MRVEIENIEDSFALGIGNQKTHIDERTKCEKCREYHKAPCDFCRVCECGQHIKCKNCKCTMYRELGGVSGFGATI